MAAAAGMAWRGSGSHAINGVIEISNSGVSVSKWRKRIVWLSAARMAAASIKQRNIAYATTMQWRRNGSGMA